MMINYSGDFHADVQKVCDLENAGLDLVWVPEAYSLMQESTRLPRSKDIKIEIGTGIINVYHELQHALRKPQPASTSSAAAVLFLALAPLALRSSRFPWSAVREADGTYP